MLERLLKNSEPYRIGDNYRGTNIVFTAVIDDQTYVVKIPRTIGPLINAYYTLQDKLFKGTRKLSFGKQMLQREAKSLEKLAGLHSPKLIEYNNDVLVREYLDGDDFKKLDSDSQRKKALEAGFLGMMDIHDKGVVIGDANVKNLLLNGDKPYWLDFDGVFDESNLAKSKAIDLLKFVYSTYSTTRDEDVTLYSAELASKNMRQGVRENVKELINPGLSSARLWLPTRIPLDGVLNKKIKKALS